MSHRDDNDLLHAAIDGALTDDGAARLRERMAGDPGVRAEADRLRQLNDVLMQVGLDEPPPGLPDQVMAAVSRREAERRTAGAKRPETAGGATRQLWEWLACHLWRDQSNDMLGREALGFSGGGAIVAKKALWAVAGLAVVAIVVFVYTGGTQSVDQGAEGTIAAANRAVGAQPASVDAAGGDAQAFLQSDTFNQIVKNKEIRSLLSNGDAVSALSNTAVLAALRDPNAKALVGDANIQAAIAQANIQSALKQPNVMAAMASAELQAAIHDAGLAKALASPAMQAALKDANLFAALQQQAQAALKTPDAALKQAGLKQVELTTQASLQAAIAGNKALAAAIGSASLQQAALANGGAMASVFAALNGPMAGVFQNASLMAALQGDRAAALFANASLYAAMNNPSFQAALRDGRLQAALQNQTALQSALAKY